MSVCSVCLQVVAEEDEAFVEGCLHRFCFSVSDLDRHAGGTCQPVPLQLSGSIASESTSLSIVS